MGKGYDTDEPEDLHTDKESKEDSSEFESFSDDVDEGSENVIAQRNVFGSDTESEGKSSPPQSHHHRSRSAKRTRPELSDSEQLEPEAAETSADKNSEQSGSPSAAEESPGPARASISSPEVASDSDDYGRTHKSETAGRLKPITDSDEADEPDDDDEDAQREPRSDQGEEPEGEEDEAEDGDEGQDPDETRIAVDFPLIRSDLGREMHLVKMPNFLSVETRPFDPTLYEDELDEDEVLDEEGRTRLKLKVENTIRWRFGKTPDGELVHESNSRIVRWSDGSLSLHLGDEIFDIHKVDIHSDYNYLFIREGSGLQGQSSLRTKLTFRPHSTDSFTHRKITLSLADKTNKLQKVKILPMAGADPESNRNLLVRKEEEKLRATLRRESQLRRMRERQAISRSSFGSGERRRHYGADDAEDDDEEDDGNTTSLNALKRKAKNALAASRKVVAAIYSSESESLSDVSCDLLSSSL
ncbi:RNA polymerase-associated protein LEO1 [Paragonimus westermani]|uniref:RNA polymerase-associated protein LEO1 n=1 Tax=Paragonimus westermani TaxID=34504 RepID=A0A5J4NB11_9TREM|nr:RNA polymerase-associated protein LEO1 [Paragonimus westermani]